MVELMVAIAIATILLGIGVPSFRALIQNQQATAAANDLFAAINLTRSEAIKRGARVELVPSGEANNWHQGWVVLIDQNNNHRPNPGEEIILSHGPVSDGIAIESNLPGEAVQFLAYNGTGRTRAMSFLFKQDDQVKRKISVNFLGRPRTCNPSTDGNSCKS